MKVYSFLKKIYYGLESYKRKKYLNGLIENGLQMGKNVYITADYFFDPSHCYLISIGDNCIFAPNVKLIAHDASIFMIMGCTKIGRINIKENCFIGDSVIVLPNVTIGPNSIIGSGSVVTKDIPPNSIAAGNPAKVITNVQDYVKKMEEMKQNKTVFGEDYSMPNLDQSKREEILRSVGDSIGFIV